MTDRQRHAIVLAYEAMMRELSSIFSRHKSLLASLSITRPAPSAKTNGVSYRADDGKLFLSSLRHPHL